jgi:hypothetical protein
VLETGAKHTTCTVDSKGEVAGMVRVRPAVPGMVRYPSKNKIHVDISRGVSADLILTADDVI